MAASLKPGRLTDCLEHLPLDWEERRCAVLISGSSRLDETSFRYHFLDKLKLIRKVVWTPLLQRGCPLDRQIGTGA